MIDAGCQIRFLSATYEGKWHDKGIADDEIYCLPTNSILIQDLGFQGFAVSGVSTCQPKKKPCGGTLTTDEKSENRRIAALRMRIEHVIGSVKRCRIVKDTLRLWREHIQDRVMETCCGLHNFRIQYRPWSYLGSHQS